MSDTLRWRIPWRVEAGMGEGVRFRGRADIAQRAGRGMLEAER